MMPGTGPDRATGAVAYGRSVRYPAVALAATLLAVGPAAAAPAPWSPPVALSSPTGVRPAGPAIAVGRTGAVAVAWVRSLDPGGSQVVEAARRARPTTPFGRTVAIDRFSGPAGPAALGVARSGIATVGWRTGNSGLPVAATLPPSGPASPFVALPATGLAERLSLGVDEDGAAVAVWLQPDLPSASLALVAADRAPGAPGFSAPVTLATAATDPRLAVAPDGRAVAAWIGPEGAVWAAVRHRATGWRPAQRLSGAAPARGPSVAMGGIGGAIVGWLEDAPTIAILDPAGAWSAPEGVAPPGPLVAKDRPAVAMDLLGQTAAVAWRQGPAPLALRVAWRGNPARPWRVSRIADPARNVGEPALAMSQSGDALVAWSHPLASGADIRARRVPRGGPLGPVETVSTGSGSRVEPALAIGSGGAVTAAWVALPSSGTYAKRIRFVAAARRLRLV